jgi:hypothetical protein
MYVETFDGIKKNNARLIFGILIALILLDAICF